MNKRVIEGIEVEVSSGSPTRFQVYTLIAPDLGQMTDTVA